MNFQELVASLTPHAVWSWARDQDPRLFLPSNSNQCPVARYLQMHGFPTAKSHTSAAYVPNSSPYSTCTLPAPVSQFINMYDRLMDIDKAFHATVND